MYTGRQMWNMFFVCVLLLLTDQIIVSVIPQCNE